MSNDVTRASRRAAVDAFFEAKRQQRQQQQGPGRLIFALDATASREPTWKMATKLQAEMFTAVGELSVQLAFYGGRKFTYSRWHKDSQKLADLMYGIKCVTGMTQIGKVLTHTKEENAKQKVSALVFIGDSVEEEPSALYAIARALGVPCFMFQEGGVEEGDTDINDPVAAIFGKIAELTDGAYCHFDAGSAEQLRELLHGVAVYATGGKQALLASGNAGAIKLLGQMKK